MSLVLDIICSHTTLLSTVANDCAESGWDVSTFPGASDFILAREKSAPPVLIFVGTGGPADQDTSPDIDALIDWHGRNAATQLILLLPEGMRSEDNVTLRLGARHQLHMPYESRDLHLILGQIAGGLGKRRLDKAIREHNSKPEGFDDIIGVSEAMQEVISLATKVGKSDCTSVMITGENGTGKGVLASAIHQISARSAGPFIEVNCAAIPAKLLESEFFGYEKGAFTDAKERKLGLFEVANRGSIFLDEVAEIQFGLQAKLLKFLDSRTVRRVSGTQFLPVDVRVISATNRNIRDDVEEKRFRADLYYRLNVVEITIPPLRSRREDIRPIAEAYAKKFSSRLKKGDVILSEDTFPLLERYTWPGNIRELINLIERAVLLNTTGVIFAADLPITPEADAEETTCHMKKEKGSLRIDIPPEGVSLDQVEEAVIIETLRRTGGNVTQAARLLEVERGTLRYKMKKRGIDSQDLKKKIKNGEFEPVSVTD
jgi:transcriptional regulator with PAS, ATPase and Fis domain